MEEFRFTGKEVITEKTVDEILAVAAEVNGPDSRLERLQPSKRTENPS